MEANADGGLRVGGGGAAMTLAVRSYVVSFLRATKTTNSFVSSTAQLPDERNLNERNTPPDSTPPTGLGAPTHPQKWAPISRTPSRRA